MTTRALDKISLHHVIMHHFMEHCCAPTGDALATYFGVEREEIASAMFALQEYHGVVLHPHCPEVWVAHPFSTAPTCFTVRYGERRWWANCAWCSLGIAALLGGNGVSIESSLGADSSPVTVQVDGGCVQEDLLVHFPVPMTRVWDNVIYADSTVLFFESDGQIDFWAKRHHIARGDSQPIQRVYQLGVAWYGHHLDEQWHKWTLDEARAIFTKLGLSGPIWELPHSSERF
jgi:Alkylmercury lyase